MISIAWYSLANFIAGFSPTLWFLLLFRALLGIGMGAEWPVGAALVMENWPQRSLGLMSGILQASGNLGFLLSSIVYGLLYNSIGWRGMLWLGICPPCRSSTSDTTSTSRRSGWRTGACSAPPTARSGPRCSPFSSGA